MSLSAQSCCVKAKKLDQKVKINVNNTGRRIVDTALLGKRMWCRGCEIPSSFSNVEEESQRGLASIFNIRCSKCSSIIGVASSETVQTGSRSTLFAVNCKAAAGCIDSGIGPEQLKNMLSATNLPIIHHNTIKRAEAQIGPAFEESAKASCIKTIAEERNLTLAAQRDMIIDCEIEPADANNDTEVEIICEYDFGWDERSSEFTFDSKSGQGSVVGHRTKKVLAWEAVSSACCMCDHGHAVEDHDCRKNHQGRKSSSSCAAKIEMPPKKRKLPNDERCIKCDLLLRYDSGQKKVIISEDEANLFSVELEKEVDVGNIQCGKCRRSTRLVKLSNLSVSDDVSQATQTLQPSQQPSQQISSGTSESQSSQSSQSFGDPFYVVRVREPTHRETIEMPFKRVVPTHKYCCVCLVRDKNYVVVPFKARLQVFISSRIFIPKNNRCCPKHLINDRFYIDEIPGLHVVSSTSAIDIDELTLFLNTLSNTCNNTLLDEVDDNNLSDERIKSLTGFTVEEINTLKNSLVSMRNSENRSINQALFVFLFKLRTGNSNSITASIFNIKYEQYVSEYCESVLDAFQKDVFPNRIGAQACSREDLIANHTSPYVKKLHGFENLLVLIADGSYLRHQKSNGYVIDVYGPYEGTVNDAQIMRKVLEDANGLRSILKKGDVFILDRGFRDVKTWLESEGFVVLMPALKGKRKQLPTIEANESRFVTKLRWVVEAVHGIISTKFKLLHNQFNNNMLTSAMLYCKVANFLVNEFGKRLNYDTDLQDEIAEQMLLKKDADNSLAKAVEEENWNRKKRIFKPLTSGDVSDFPEMTEKDLKILFTGSYQLSLSVSYLAEIYTEEGFLNMQFLLENNSILRCEVKSRHMNRKVYKCYVHYTPNTVGCGGFWIDFIKTGGGCQTPLIPLPPLCREDAIEDDNEIPNVANLMPDPNPFQDLYNDPISDINRDLRIPCLKIIIDSDTILFISD
ncbi:hypothetical protein PV327_004088 [Microctonus hyperodae]|uniref:DDE Tnp4 domain-containing protein n=1 Tax=Microctonus hyperodae TaxID=165561 RepID=A0AA39FBQ9_MICHY|nr:hypothetical protein PV327_004088 [Microctonus hyperodae]